MKTYVRPVATAGFCLTMATAGAQAQSVRIYTGDDAILGLKTVAFECGSGVTRPRASPNHAMMAKRDTAGSGPDPCA